jgi:alkanesulfonate monooxygenase SsuD/methylene tetrahydromethanopterin reductase-like flavin-dependent oxidoreductase (luciferase family)
MFGFSHEKKDYEYFLSHGSVVVGSPEKVAEELAEYNERTGINKIISWFNVGGQPHAQTMETLELFSAEVMPALKSVQADGLRRGAMS